MIVIYKHFIILKVADAHASSGQASSWRLILPTVHQFVKQNL